jgi:hypothetical protein
MPPDEELAEAERRRKYQRELDRYWMMVRDLEEADRRRQRELDPFGYGHWN